MEVLVHQKKSINFSKGNKKCCLSMHYNTNNSYLFVDGKEVCLVLSLNPFRTAKAATNDNHRLCPKSKPQVRCH